MRTRISRVLTVAAALAAASVGLITTSASANTAGAAATGPITMSPSPASGAALGSVTILPPSGAACAGDTAAGGYRWQSFMIAASQDPNTVTFNNSGPVVPAGTFGLPLYSSTGTPIINQGTAAVTGVLTPFPTFSFAALSVVNVPSGAYNVGFACTNGGVSDRLWFSPVTVVSAGATGVTSVTFGSTPSAPVLTSPLTAGLGSLAGTFTLPAATPAATGSTVTAVPTAGATVSATLAAGVTSFTLTGLTNGTSYSVTVTQTNTVGTSAASNVVSGTPGQFVAAPVVSASPAPQAVTVNWIPTAGANTASSFIVTAGLCAAGTTTLTCTVAGSTPVAGSPFTAAAGSTSQLVSGLAAGSLYVFTVQAVYPTVGVNGAVSGPVFATAFANTLILQDVSVTRPAGALVLTQRCGVYAGLPAETVPGFGTIPGDVGVGVDPATGIAAGGTAPTTGQAAGGPADPLFPAYPYPVDANGVPNANYPTHCGVNLGIGKLITTGSLAGEYFTAVGRLNQVTVVDTRDSNSTWTLSGSASTFTGPSDTFSADYLGWTPWVTNTSGATLTGYDQVVTAGAVVNPSSTATVTGVNNLAGVGLANSRTAAVAPAGQGLGIATIDARLKLLIPLTAKNGVYTSVLTFTVA